jgi:hypothetical protein
MHGRGHGRNFGRGFGRGYARCRPHGPGRGPCGDYYRQHGTWPAWSRRVGGPGYWWREGADATEGEPEDWTPPADEVAQLRREVQELKGALDEIRDHLLQGE